jgi:methylated-DNA-[protein]-cysteine S-methyltransferase
MGQTVHHYLIFKTAGGFCGIAWNNVGITRFQLPTKSAEATERTLLRRAPGAQRGAPTPGVVEAVAAVKRYFEGEETEVAREVGQALAKHPVALIIPCHRVLAAGGKVGGFSAPGGSTAKIRMLALEGIHVEPPRPAQQSFGF